MKKNKFKMPTSFTILLILTSIMAFLTFIIPAGQYTYKNGAPVAKTYKYVASNPQGIWDIFSAPIKGFSSAIEIIMFILVLGGCLGIIFETKAVDASLGQVVKKLKGKEKLIIPIIMIICAIGGTTYGMAEETIAFYPIILPILIAAGYDVVTGVMVIFLGAGVGISGGLINPFSVGIGSNLANISLGDGIFIRLALFISYLIFAITFTLRYAEKVRKNPKASIVYDIRHITNEKFMKTSDEILEFDRKRKQVIIVFGLMFAIMIIAIIPWSSKFDVHIFDNFNNMLLGLPVIGKILGHLVPFGDWYFSEMTTLFFIGSIIIGKIYGYKENKIVQFFVAGAKDLLGVALILGVAKGLTIIMQEGLIIDTILNYGENLLTKVENQGYLFPGLSYLLYIPMSLLIPSSSGLQTATIPILAPLADFIHIKREFIVMACQAGSETMNYISPTQAVLMGALALTNIPFDRWLKHIIPYFLGTILITVSILTISNLL